MALPKKKKREKIRGHAIHSFNGINNLGKYKKENRNDIFSLFENDFDFFYYTDIDL